MLEDRIIVQDRGGIDAGLAAYGYPTGYSDGCGCGCGC